MKNLKMLLLSTLILSSHQAFSTKKEEQDYLNNRLLYDIRGKIVKQLETNEQRELNSRLLDAIKDKSLGKVKSLIKEGADINSRNNFGETALMYSVWCQAKSDIVKYIISYSQDNNINLDINAQNKYGEVALMYAACYNTASVEHLIKSGADLDIKDNYGETALMTAIYHDQLGSVKLLVESGASLEAKNNYGWTALVVAVKVMVIAGRKPDIVKYLVLAGADINQVKDNSPDQYQIVLDVKNGILLL